MESKYFWNLLIINQYSKRPEESCYFFGWIEQEIQLLKLKCNYFNFQSNCFSYFSLMYRLLVPIEGNRSQLHLGHQSENVLVTKVLEFLDFLDVAIW